MKTPRWTAAVALLLTMAFQANGQNDSSKVVKVEIKAEGGSIAGQKSFSVQLTIEKGWHVYANPAGNPDLATAQTTVTVKSDGKTLPCKVTYPLGHLVKDPIVGDYITYEGKVAIKGTVTLPPDVKAAEVVVKFQACNDKTCLPPALTSLKLP
ncbi:MAG: hypothetical protein EXR99_10460 [Gemmataceae bacterium]|nr:hypothetical protein [Gemmataceae bacterium]